MAAQPLSNAAPVYSPAALIDTAASRPLTGTGSVYSQSGLVELTPSRPLSPAGALYSQGGLARIGATRAVSPAIGAYATAHFVSLSSFRALSMALAQYGSGSIARLGAARPVTVGFSLFVPVPPAPPPPPPDTQPPVVGNYSPAVGTALSRTTPVSFDVTDDGGAFRRIFVAAFFPATGVVEVIHDGDAFRGFYAATSARRAIPNGFRYTVLRSDGWPAAPTIQTFAIDLAGNEVN